MEKFDILITTISKDYNKLPFVINSIRRNICGFNDIYCVSPNPIPMQYKLEDVVYAHDFDFNFDCTKLKNVRRRGWYRQQFIKLFQWITNDNYLVIDSDVILLKPLSVFNEKGIPYFFLGNDQNHPSYFEFMRRMFGFGRMYNHSFINEIMFFRREYIIEMVNSIEKGILDFIDNSILLINDINHVTSSFSEYETYGNWITYNKPKSYDFIKLNVKNIGKTSQFSNIEIEKYIERHKDNYDKLNLHSWI